MSGVPKFGKREEGRVYTLRPAAYGVILDANGSLACVGESSGLFLPGGGMRNGETPEETLAREVREECAFEVSITGRLGSAVQYFVSGAGVAYRLEASFFRAQFGAAVSSPPELELRFISKADAAQRLFHECHRWAVARAGGGEPR